MRTFRLPSLVQGETYEEGIGSKSESIMPVLEGTTLGHYHLMSLLGHGGMAEVYLAFDEYLHREVAIKVVHGSRTAELARFHREAEMLGSLDHEHILPVFEYGEQGPWHYLVMPYLSHGTLRERVEASGPLSEEEAGLLLEQIASALQYAHERGILHRDIKPSNILLRDDAYAYVADFGIARALGQESDLTQTGVVIGTPEYIAPELLEQPANVGSDIYALGILLYYMLTGQVPFSGPSTLAILQQHVNAPPARPSQLNPAISMPVEQVVLAALEKDPQQRFRTPQAMAHAYRLALQQSPLSAHRHPQTEPDFFTGTTIEGIPVPLTSTSPVTRVRRPAAFIAVSALVLILLLAVAHWSGAFGSNAGNQAVSRTPVTHVSTSPSPSRTPSPTTTSVSCSVNDTANILDQTRVCEAAQTLSYPITVYTTRVSQNEDGDSNNQAQSLVTSPRLIVIAINLDSSHPHLRVHVSIVGGNEVPLNDSQYQQAMDAFNHVADSGDYTEATIEAIQNLHMAGA
jgi:serine/threonine protein kinase